MIDFEYLTNPEKYHTVPPRIEGEKDEQYKARLGAYVHGIESQQAKIDELQRKIAFQEKVIKNIKLQFENKQIDCDRSDRKIDELQKKLDCCREENKALLERLAVYDKHVKAIKHIYETQFDKNTDTSFILGNLDGFIEYLESDLKGR